jgi:hypothetical protein
MLLSATQAMAQEPLTACGEPPPGGGGSARPVKATLSLDGETKDPILVTDAPFGRKTDVKKMTLVYNVTGCEMGETEPLPQTPLRIYPPKSGDIVPDNALVLDGDPAIEGSRYIVRLKVSSETFNPGSYSGLVEIKAGWLNAVRTPVSISRSENRRRVPLGWGALGGLAGFLLFALMRKLKKNDLLVGRGLLIAVFGVSVTAGMVAAYTTSYINQDVWVSSENWWAALVAGFTGATSGVMVGLLSAVWKEPKK